MTDHSAGKTRGPSAPANLRWKVIVACAGMLVAFYLLSWWAVQTKSAVTDEPGHLLVGSLNLHDRDFRYGAEAGTVLGYWAMLPHLRSSPIAVNKESHVFRELVRNMDIVGLVAIDTYFVNEQREIDALLGPSRAVVLLVGCVLGALIGVWAWKLGGAVGALVACGLFAADPNFLGHAALVKNDVMLAATLTGVVMLLWHMGHRVTWARMLGLGVLCALAVGTKLSGLIVGPIVCVLLLVRVLLPGEWRFEGKSLSRPVAKGMLAGGILVCAMLVAWTVTWGLYQFQYASSATQSHELSPLLEGHAQASLTTELGRAPTQREIEAYELGATVSTLLWLDRNHLIPRPFTAGLLYVTKATTRRASYLLGQISEEGWWYYFPLAMLFKTPTATLVAMLLSGVVLVTFARRASAHIWSFACMAIPAMAYMVALMGSSLNSGIKYALPVYPFLFVAVGCTASMAVARWDKIGRPVTIVLLLGLLIESLLAFPNYVAFFNAPSGGSRGGYHLLGDTNLDWGQDLKLIAQWQSQHPDEKLYLNYFGIVPPETYGIQYANLPGGYYLDLGLPKAWPQEPGVIAISATHLQGITYPSQLREAYEPLRKLQSREVLGGTIYLFDFPQPALTRESFPHDH